MTKIRYRAVLVICLLLTMQLAEAQNQSIKGKVLTSDGKPAQNVSVIVDGQKTGAMTDEAGAFQLSRLKPGTYTIRVSALGLSAQEREVTITTGEAPALVFTLTEDALRLSEISLSATKTSYKTDKPSSSLRLAGPLLETPQNIQVITGQVLKDQQIFDMLEGVTRNVSGASREAHWDNYARITMRGANIGAFRNGMNVTMPWGPLTEDMSIVDRIEFVKGPAGFMLANGEPAGFYNLVTKKPTGVTRGEATLSLGSFDTYRATTDLDGKLSDNGKLLYRFNVMGMLKGSHRQYDYNNRYTLAPVISYKVDDKTLLTAEYTYQFSQSPLLGAAYVFGSNGYATSSRNTSLLEPNIDPTKINDHSAFLTLNHTISDQWKFTAQLGYLTFTQKGSSTWPEAIFDAGGAELESGVYPNGDVRRSVNIWDAWGQNKLGQVFLNGNVSTGAVSHKLLGGLDMGNKQYLGYWGESFVLNGPGALFNIYQPVYGQVPASDIPVYDRTQSLRQRAGASMNYENYTGLYVQDELGFAEDKVRLTLAGRYTSLRLFDGYSAPTDDGKFTPRLGLSVSIDPSTSVYGLFDRSFIAQSGLIYGGGKIKPLDGDNIEFGIKRDWSESKWSTTLTAYQITKRNVMAADPDPSHLPVGVYSVQVGKVRNKGIEFDLRGELAKGLDLTLNYAYTDSKILENAGDVWAGASIDGYAKHLTNGWLAYHLTEGKAQGLGLSLGYQYQADRVAGAWGGINPLNVSLGDYFRMDGAITWQNARTSLSLNVNNILNAYLYTGAPYDDYYYWQSEPGTNFRLGVGYKF